jgi:hypothetical protein
VSGFRIITRFFWHTGTSLVSSQMTATFPCFQMSLTQCLALTWFRHSYIKRGTTAHLHSGVCPTVLLLELPLHPCEMVESPPGTVLSTEAPAVTGWHCNQHMSLGTWQLCGGSNNICNQTQRQCSRVAGYTKCSGISIRAHKPRVISKNILQQRLSDSSLYLMQQQSIASCAVTKTICLK